MVKIEVTKCKECPFFKKDVNLMYCDHPYFWGRPRHVKMIINNINKESIPLKCPLRNGDIKQIATIGLKK